MNCKFCGTDLKDDAKFCSECGKLTENGVAQQGRNQQPNVAQSGGQQQNGYQQPNVAQSGGQQQNGYQQPNSAQNGGYQQNRYQQQNSAQNGEYQQNGYQQQNSAQSGGYQQNTNNYVAGVDYTSQFHPQDIQSNKDINILSYLGPLLLIPLLTQPNSPYTKFHCNQGIIVFLLYVAIGILSSIIGSIAFFNTVFFILVVPTAGIFGVVCIIIGIINTVNGRAKELPIIGKIKILR